MNATSLKALCTISSAVLSAGLAFVLWDYFQNQVHKPSPFDEAFAAQVLKEEPGRSSEVKRSVDYKTKVKPGWIQLDWTGAPPPPEPVAEVVEKEEPKIVYTPVSDLLAIVYIRFDTDDAAGSLALVRYLKAAKKDAEGTLKIGDKLPSPNQNIEVSAIYPTGIEFKFLNSEREAELLSETRLTDGDLIHVVDAGGEIAVTKRPVIARGQTQTFRPEATTLIATDRYRLGTEDMRYLGENYTDVLTRDMSTRTHYDANGRRAGIELTRVRRGSIAARHGAMEGDIVISINGEPVNSPQEAINFAKNNKDRYTTWDVVVENLGHQRTMTFETPAQ